VCKNYIKGKSRQGTTKGLKKIVVKIELQSVLVKRISKCNELVLMVS